MGVARYERKICSCSAESTSAPNELDTDRRSWLARARGLFRWVDESAVFSGGERRQVRLASAFRVDAFFREETPRCSFGAGYSHTEFLMPPPRGSDSDASSAGRAPSNFHQLNFRSSPFLPRLQTIPLVDALSPSALLCAHQSLSLFPAVPSAASPFTACSGCCKAFTLLIFPKQTQ